MGELYFAEVPGDEPLVMVKVMNSTLEPDGSPKPYFLRVHPQCRLLLPKRRTWSSTANDSASCSGLNVRYDSGRVRETLD